MQIRQSEQSYHSVRARSVMNGKQKGGESQPASRATSCLDRRGGLSLLDAGQHKPGSLALAVGRLLLLGGSQSTILEHVGERAVLALAAGGDAAYALHALATLLARARAVGTDRTPAAAGRSP